MKAQDFGLSKDELARLNAGIQARAQAVSEEDGASVSDISVTFMFAPGIGRMVMLSVDGSEPVDLDDIPRN